MGSRHNRKRTRSRPRNRNNRKPSCASIIPLIQQSPTFPGSSFAQKPPNHWHQQYSQWQERIKHQKTLQEEQARARETYERAMEAERLRMFGGEAGDEVSLCAPMLDVVMTLFNGNIDYQDP